MATGIAADGSAIYETLPGWETSTTGIRSFERLPKNAQTYLKFIEKVTKVPVQLIGTGPGREDMISRV